MTILKVQDLFLPKTNEIKQKKVFNTPNCISKGTFNPFIPFGRESPLRTESHVKKKSDDTTSTAPLAVEILMGSTKIF